MVFIPQAQPHAQSLFLFPIVFGINLYGVSLVFACVEIEGIRELKRTCRSSLNRSWEYYIGDEDGIRTHACKSRVESQAQEVSYDGT